MPNAGPDGLNSDYIGIDTYSYDDQPTDVTAPDTTLVTGPASATREATTSFEFSASEAGSTFECSLDGAAFGPCSGPGATHTLAGLTDGSHAFAVRAMDAAGNVDPTPATWSFTVDTTAPGTTIDSGPEGDTADATPTFEFSSSEAGSTFECSLDDAAFGPCSGPGATHTTAALAEGTHTFAVRAADAVGNVDASPATTTFTVDVTAPETSIDSGPSGDTADATPTFGFSSAEAGATFECSVDDAAFGPCSGPGATHTTAELAEGAHTFAVRATDALGNVDPTPATQPSSSSSRPSSRLWTRRWTRPRPRPPRPPRRPLRRRPRRWRRTARRRTPPSRPRRAW